MPRPTNEELYNEPPDIEAGTEAAVTVAHDAYPQATKVLRAAFTDEGCEVTVGWADGTVYRIVDVMIDADNVIVDESERKDKMKPEKKKPKKTKPEKKTKTKTKTKKK